MRIILIVAVLVSLMCALPVYAQDSDTETLKRRIEELEERTRRLEKDVLKEHTRMLEDMRLHLETLERNLAMVDYRTGRLRAMEERLEAFTIGGDLTMFLQAVADNPAGPDGAEGSYSADLFLMAPAGLYGNVYFRGNIGEGDGIVPSLPAMFSGPNADLEFNQPVFNLVEAWYWTEFPLPDTRDRRLELTIGKIDPTALFDTNRVANSETDQFAANIFVNNIAIDFGGDDNYYGAGLSVAYRFTSIYNKGLKVTGRVGIFEGDGDFKDILDRPFAIAELDVWRPYYGLNGNYRFYIWTNETAHTDPADPSANDLSNRGVGMSIDQEISTDVALFLRYGIQRERAAQFDMSISAGVQILGNSWKRGNDRLGMAYGMTRVSSPYRESTSEVDADYEHHAEVYYKWWANKNLSVTPDIQYVANAGGVSGNDLFIYGARMQLAF